MAAPGRKIFVGSLPTDVSDATLRATFSQYGQVEDIYIKQGCEVGRQWAFVTFATPEQAQRAKESCDRVLTFPGVDRPCDVMVARNQGMFGQNNGPTAPGDVGAQLAHQAQAPMPGQDGPKKIFVGSLPDGITSATLQAEFSKYGMITDTYVKQGCEMGRQWAFITYSSAAEAQLAKVSADRILVMAGCARAVEVTLARNQGLFGNEAMTQDGALQAAAQPAVSSGPRKVFVGSLPDTVNEEIMRSTFEKYGQITDIYVKNNCEPGRQWAFLTFATPEQASFAKESCDRVLVIPGGDRPCEVMLAKNQGRFGQDPMNAANGAAAASALMLDPYQAQATALAALYGQVQPPPPTAPAPLTLTPWRCYHTAAGLPYYHNHSTGVTQWECPPDLGVALAAAAAAPQVRFAPY